MYIIMVNIYIYIWKTHRFEYFEKKIIEPMAMASISSSTTRPNSAAAQRPERPGQEPR